MTDNLWIGKTYRMVKVVASVLLQGFRNLDIRTSDSIQGAEEWIEKSGKRLERKLVGDYEEFREQKESFLSSVPNEELSEAAKRCERTLDEISMVVTLGSGWDSYKVSDKIENIEMKIRNMNDLEVELVRGFVFDEVSEGDVLHLDAFRAIRHVILAEISIRVVKLKGYTGG